jgi:RNA polymerase sigma-54 factor
MKPGNRISVQQTQRLALTTRLAASIQILRADSEGLSRYLEEQATENPALVLSRPNPVEWTPRWKSVLSSSGEPPEAEAAAPSLVSHALALVEAQGLSAANGRIALGRSLADISRSVGASMSEVEAVLERLQSRAEPTGLFARTLAECLRLQASDAGELDRVMDVVLNRLDLVARGDVDRIARDAGADRATVLARIGTLRGYDPKPGSRFEPFAASAREPDLIAEKGDAGWTVALNRSALPTLAVPDGRGKGRAGARAIVRMVEGRNATLLSVGREILLRQVAALEQGPGGLVPMTMSDVAGSLGLSESTVSRVVAGAAVDTPMGTWWLRALFTQSLHEGGVSAGALRDRLARLVKAEDPSAPLPDADLAAALADGGTPIARRTVAKYRVQLGIPPAHRRRQRR